MSKKAYEKIAAGLDEALLIARGEALPARLHVPPEIDIKSIRARLKLSQEGFAVAFGFTINQVKDWEQGRSQPIGGVRAYIMLIGTNPDEVRALLRDSQRQLAPA